MIKEVDGHLELVQRQPHKKESKHQMVLNDQQQSKDQFKVISGFIQQHLMHGSKHLLVNFNDHILPTIRKTGLRNCYEGSLSRCNIMVVITMKIDFNNDCFGRPLRRVWISLRNR